MRPLVIAIPLLFAFFGVGGCHGSKSGGGGGLGRSDGPGLTSIGVDVDDGSSLESFKFLGGFAASPGQIVALDVNGPAPSYPGQQYATAVVEEIVAEWNYLHPGTAWDCNAETGRRDVVMFNAAQVANLAVISGTSFLPIASEITLGNGIRARIVTKCPE